jgi:hypothetical protein
VFFAAGQSSQRFFVHTLDDSLADGDRVLAFALASPTGGALGSLTSTVLGLIDNEGLRLGLDGQPIADVVMSDMTGTGGNNCGARPNLAGNIGPCGASPVSPAGCDEGMVDAITNAWLIDIDPISVAGSSLKIPLRPRHVMSFRFRTPPIGTPAMYQFATDEHTSLGAAVPTFTSISPKRCDFDYRKLAAQDFCFLTGAPNGKWAVTAPADGAQASTYCMLQPDAEYYFNIRMESASNGAGRDQCLIAATAAGADPGTFTCGVLAATFGYRL